MVPLANPHRHGNYFSPRGRTVAGHGGILLLALESMVLIMGAPIFGSAGSWRSSAGLRTAKD